jgi:hypothetical protein
VTDAAPRIDERLVAALARLDDPEKPIAETWRRLGAVATSLGLAGPSYQQVRVLVHELRGRRRDPSVGSVLLDVALRNRPPEAFLDALADHPRTAL